MRLFLALAALCVSATVVVGYPQSQQSVDPAYLRQYYAHLAQANREGQEATPIYEQGQQEQVYKGDTLHSVTNLVIVFVHLKRESLQSEIGE